MTWPRISIIIPSYNQGQYIEQTLQSVMEQNYPNLELIVMDACSTDGTGAILDRYRERISILEIKKDRGQSHAINKGMARMTGEVWAYLNSDDLLLPGSLARIGELFRDPNIDWVGAISSIFDDHGDTGQVVPQAPRNLREIVLPWHRSVQHVFPCSNVCFMRRAVYERIGAFDESYHYSMDMEYYTRAVFNDFTLHRLPEVLGRWRWHPESKTVRDGQAYRFLEEELRIASLYAVRLPPDDCRSVRREIAEQSKWFAVRRALHENPQGTRHDRLRRLFQDARKNPALFLFRPWLGAVKKQLRPL
jgi:glycosyltransferase involved in cell wall biosynthesis